MKISLFGGLNVQSENASRLRLQTDKIRALLAYLAVHANRPISRTQLATLLWGDSTDKIASRNLRLSLSRLKKAFVAEGLTSPIETTRSTAEFVTGVDVLVDSVLCDELWQRCILVKRDRWEAEDAVIDALTQLAGHYKGDFLAGLTLEDCIEFDSWVAVQREQYHQRTLRALEVLADHHLQRTEYDSAEKYAQQALTLEAWHETAHRQLITLYRLTNQDRAARAQFEQCKIVLWDELGAEPSPSTVAALKITSLIKQKAFVKIRPKTDKPKHNLPAEHNAFLGREAEIAQLQQLLSNGSTRLITLHGEGGMGKTRLARAVAATQTDIFTDGVYFVSLVGIDEPSAIASAIIETLEIQLQGRKTSIEQLCNYLSERKLLLVVDNLEHLLNDEDETVDLLLDLLDAAPHIVLLVTSRQRLWVQAETVLRLNGLPVPDPSVNGLWRQYASVQLFVARMQQVDIDFDQAAHREPILQICRAVQGLPLGIELAAAQSSLWSCAAVAQELSEGLGLRTRMRDVPKRQRSLENVFNYSWRLLREEIRPILARCAIMRGDFNFEAFRAVTGGRRHDLETLIAHALVRQAGDGRYDMHEMVRQTAVTKLDSAERSAATTRYGNHFLTLVTQFKATYFFELDTFVLELRSEWPHIEQAWAWAVETESAELIRDTSCLLLIYWEIGGSTATAIPMLDAAQARFESSAPHAPLAKTTLQHVIAVRLWHDSAHEKLRQAWTSANAILENDAQGIAPFLRCVANVVKGKLLCYTTHVSHSIQFLNAGLALAKAHHFYHMQFVARYLGMVTLANNQDLAEAQCFYDDAQTLNKRSQSDYWSTYQDGWLLVWRWRLSEGVKIYEQQYALLRRLKREKIVDAALTTRAFAYYKAGFFEKAIMTLTEHEPLEMSNTNTTYNLGAIYVLCMAFRRLGNVEEAVRFGRLGYEGLNLDVMGFFHLWTCNAYGLALCDAGQLAEAQAVLRQAYLRIQGSELESNWHALIGGSLAHSYALAGDWDAASQLADDLYETFISADSIYARLEQMWYCYEILHHVGDVRAATLLAQCRAVLAWRGDQLADPDFRHAFFTNFPEHRQLLSHSSGGVLVAH